jgi:hypothetical protein
MGRAVAIALLLALSSAAMATAQPAGEPGPPLATSEADLAAALSCPDTFAHPDHPAVLLVHGTGSNPQESWSWNWVEVLPAAGFDVCTVEMPGYALVDIQLSAEYVVYAIRSMHEATGRPVSVIGHSQGTLQPRWAIRWWDDIGPSIDDYISMAGPHHGISFADTCVTLQGCAEAMWQMRSGSAFLVALNAGDETPGSVSYTSLYTDDDESITPVATAELDGAVNVRIQALCPNREVGHGGFLHDAVVFALVIDALTHEGPADPARVPPEACAEAHMPGISDADVLQGNAQAVPGLARILAARAPNEPSLRPYAVEPTPDPADPAPQRAAPPVSESAAPQPQVAATPPDTSALPATGREAGGPTALAGALVLAAFAIRRAGAGSTGSNRHD